jgi:peptidoglycan/xylan/chitin deacetylase (PgdA/CDA1 family)
MLVRALGRLYSPAGHGAALSILIFHRVLERADALQPGEPDAARFDAILGWLRRSFNVMPLEDAIDALADGRLPGNAAAITFDDGYADNAEVALPVLVRHGLHATFFIASGYLDGGRMFNDTVVEGIRRHEAPSLDLRPLGLGLVDTSSPDARRASIDALLRDLKYRPPMERAQVAEAIGRTTGTALPADLMMTTAQLRKLRASGMAIGAHTRHHPILAMLDDADARSEIEQGKRDLERLLGEPVTLFAYPNGKPQRDYAARHAGMVRAAGFRAAVSTSPGVARASSDMMQLPRFTPWDRSEVRFGLRLVNNMRIAGAGAS